MKKESFLEKLETKLNILDDKEQKKLLKKYSDMIDASIKDGLSEEASIEALGDIDKLVKKILKEYKISSDYIDKNNNNFEDLISRFIKYIVDGTHDFISKVEKKDFRSIAEIIIYILVAMFAFWILRLPFYIVEVIGNGIFNLFANPIGIGLAFLWSFIVNICYFLLVIWIIVIIFNKVTNKDIKIKLKKEVKKEPVIKDEIKENITKSRHVILEVFYVLLKVLVVIMMLPLIFLQIGLFIALGVVAVLVFKGIILVGPLLILIGIAFILGVIMNLIFYLTFNKGGNK